MITWRQTLRRMRARPGFTAVIVLTIALGIGLNTAFFSIVHAVLWEPLPFRDPARIAVLSEHSRTMDTSLVSPITFDDWDHRNEAFSEVAAFRHWENRTLEFGNADPEPVLHVTVTPNYFRVLGLQPLIGRTNGVENPSGTSEAVLSQELWVRRFGADKNVLGKTIRISGTPFVVVGVMPAGPRDLSIGWGDVWTPLHWYDMQKNRATSYRARYLRVIGRLNPGLSIAQARVRMETLQSQLAQEATSVAKGYSVRVETLEDVLVGRFRRALFVLFGAVGFVLLIACANVANLMLARSASHERDIAVRMALGASRVQLARELLMESSVLGSLGTVLGMLLAWWGLWLLKHQLAEKVPRIVEAGLSAPVCLFTLVLLAGCVLFFGLLPLSVIDKADIHEKLKEGGRSGSGGVRQQHARKLLVISEFAFAVVLLIGGGLLLKSFARLLRVDPGFETTQRITVDVILPVQQYQSSEKRIAFFRELFRRMDATTGMKSSGAALYFPCRSKLWLATIWRENIPVDRGEEPVVYYNLIAGDYFRAMGIPLIEGRFPTERELWEPSDVVLINETFARQLFPGTDPIDRRIKSGEDGHWNRIIGVVGDVRQKSLDEPPKAEYYEPFPQMPMPFMTIAAETSLPDPVALQQIQSILNSSDPSITVNNLTKLGTLLGNTVGTQRLAMALLLLFAAAAVGLSALGIYGVMNYGVNQRKNELGVRMAIGATPAQVFLLIIGEGLRTALMGAAIGVVGSIACANVMRGLLYETQSFDWSVYTGIVALSVLTAFAALYLPAWRAAHIDPVASLHAE